MIKTGKHAGTYKASFQALVAAASAAPFFILAGATAANNRRIKLKKLTVSGMSLTAVQYLSLVVSKYSTEASSGTATDATAVPLSSSYGAAKASVIKGYTAAPTAGTEVGIMASARVMGQATTAAAAGIPQIVSFDFDEDDTVELLTNIETVGLRFSTAPATAVTMNVDVEWVEEFIAI